MHFVRKYVSHNVSHNVTLCIILNYVMYTVFCSHYIPYVLYKKVFINCKTLIVRSHTAVYIMYNVYIQMHIIYNGTMGDCLILFLLSYMAKKFDAMVYF